MDISVSHAPSTYALEIHAEQMSVRVVEVDVSSILKSCVCVGCVPTCRLVYRACSVPL